MRSLPCDTKGNSPKPTVRHRHIGRILCVAIGEHIFVSCIA